MNENEAAERIAVSRRVILGWMREAPRGGLENNLKMIRTEIEILEEIARQIPELASEGEELILRYRELQDQVKARAH